MTGPQRQVGNRYKSRTHVAGRSDAREKDKEATGQENAAQQTSDTMDDEDLSHHMLGTYGEESRKKMREKFIFGSHEVQRDLSLMQVQGEGGHSCGRKSPGKPAGGSFALTSLFQVWQSIQNIGIARVRLQVP